MRGNRQFADSGGIAQTEIEALGADRRYHVRGFADQRDALVGKTPRGGDAERKQPAAGFDLDLAEDRMRGALDLVRQSRVVEFGDFVGMMRRRAPRPDLTVGRAAAPSVNGPLGVWNSVEVSRCGRECFRQTVSATWL